MQHFDELMFLSVVFIIKRELASQLRFSAEILIFASWNALILQQSSEANAVSGVRASPIIGHVTAGLLSLIACTFHSGMEGGGGM